MVTVLSNPEFMTREEMNTKFEGIRLLVAQSDEDKYFREGMVIAIGDDSDEDLGELSNLQDSICKGKGFIYYAHVDKGEDLHVTFGPF